MNFSHKAFSHGDIYAPWDVDEIVAFELWRNLGVAMLCIFVITMLLLNEIALCLFVVGSVVITLVNVIGFVQFWEISIDIVSLCTFVVTIGICVDYPAHIAHSYLISTGKIKFMSTTTM